MMKRETTKYRISRILDADKEDMNEATRAAAVADFERIAREYFETEGDVVFTVKKEKTGISVAVQFRAVRIKNFTTLK